MPACASAQRRAGLSARAAHAWNEALPQLPARSRLERSRDLLINARWIVPVEPRDAVLADHAVAIRGGRIVDLLGQDGRAHALRRGQVVELPRHLLIPGLVNLHTHAAMSLLRGIADDLPLMRWLEEAIWPAESRHVSTPPSCATAPCSPRPR